jgi:amino acid transporter
MQSESMGQLVLGLFFILVGLLMIIFRKQLKEMREEWYERLPWVVWRRPTGTALTVTIILFGIISIVLGMVQVILATNE